MVLRVVGDSGANTFTLDAAVCNHNRKGFQWRYRHTTYVVRPGNDNDIVANMLSVLSEAGKVLISCHTLIRVLDIQVTYPYPRRVYFDTLFKLCFDIPCMQNISKGHQ